MFEMRNRFDFDTPPEIVDHRLEMIQVRIKDNVRVEDILEEYNLSRPVFYKFLKRYHDYGKLGLHNFSRAPLNHGRKTLQEKENSLLALCQKYPFFSSYELHELVSIPAKTIQRILRKRAIKKSYLPKSQKKTILQKLRMELQQKRNKPQK